jgi:hypothetical protein
MFVDIDRLLIREIADIFPRFLQDKELFSIRLLDKILTEGL